MINKLLFSGFLISTSLGIFSSAKAMDEPEQRYPKVLSISAIELVLGIANKQLTYKGETYDVTGKTKALPENKNLIFLASRTDDGYYKLANEQYFSVPVQLTLQKKYSVPKLSLEYNGSNLILSKEDLIHYSKKDVLETDQVYFKMKVSGDLALLPEGMISFMAVNNERPLCSSLYKKYNYFYRPHDEDSAEDQITCTLKYLSRNFNS